jgi:hypothetical protein
MPTEKIVTLTQAQAQDPDATERNRLLALRIDGECRRIEIVELVKTPITHCGWYAQFDE